MSSDLARREIRRFLSNGDAEVLSVSGRWGVGKTYTWVTELAAARAETRTPRDRYSYVSAFGLKSVKELREALFQNTIRLDGPDIRPSVESLRENLSSIDGGVRLAEWSGRRLAKAAGGLLSLVPWAGSAGELLLPAATLLIKDQLICIDDVERAGDGLDISEVLGVVSQLKEERGCKVILLLNEEGLGGDKPRYRRYLEKVVDQSVEFQPTAAESALIALPGQDPISEILSERTQKLGVTNIRVMKRIARFLGHIAPLMTGWHDETRKQAVHSVALFGWSIFEPELAPSIDSIRSYNRYAGLFGNDEGPSDEVARVNHFLGIYGFGAVDEFDEVLIEGLQCGAFDEPRLASEAEKLNKRFENAEARAGVSRPWDIFGDSFADNEGEVVEAIMTAVADFGGAMAPTEINAFYQVLKDLGHDDKAQDALNSYMAQRDDMPREFFEPSSHRSFSARADPVVLQAFQEALAKRPLERDPVEALTGIERLSGWNPEDIEFLASLTDDQLVEIFKQANGDDLRDMLRGALRFVDSVGGPESYAQFGRRAKIALERIAAESKLNAMRLRPYLSQDEPKKEV